MTWVVAPRPTARGEVVVGGVGDAHALSLYPRVKGRTFGWGPYDDPDHRSAVLDRLVDLHTTTGCRGVAGTDDLGRALVAGLRALLQDPRPPWQAGPFSQEAWQLVVERGVLLHAVLDRYEESVGTADPARFVVTHGEPHRGNTLVTDGGVVLVDRDTCLLAPPERDVWLVVGKDPGILAVYEERTGTILDRRLLEGYRLRWDLADAASFAAELRGPHEGDEDARTALGGLRAVLAPAQPHG